MKWLTIFMIILITGVTLTKQAAKTVTLEDVRDALLHVVNLVRQNDDKLERHEFRDRQSGDQVKKSLITIDKRLKSMEPLRGTVMRLDERIADIETILIKKNEREDSQLQKTADTVEDIQRNLPLIIDNIKKDIIAKIAELNNGNSKPSPSQPSKDAITKSDLKNFQDELKRDLNEVKTSMKSMGAELNKLKNESHKFNEMNEKSSDSLEKVKRQLSDSENLLAKYENKLAEMSNKIPSILPPPNYKEQQELQSNVLQALDTQKSKVDRLVSDIQDVASKLGQMPQNQAFDKINNNTLKALENLRRDTMQQAHMTNSLLEQHQQENNEGQSKLLQSIQDVQAATAMLRSSTENNFENVTKEIKDLGRFEQVLLQSANGVLDTKRRVEYGVHQILLEMEELLKTHVKELNTTMNDRFDNFEMSILDDEAGALANLTSKIGEEIDQVWRQIGIMHQRMSLNTDTLNKLHNQTDLYVNGSMNVMDSMKGKVGQITGKMSEVDDNLNYLLGRLSLVTQEFNMIKTGLGKALDQIKGSFIEVQNKIKDSGPGPHNITSNEVNN